MERSDWQFGGQRVIIQYFTEILNFVHEKWQDEVHANQPARAFTVPLIKRDVLLRRRNELDPSPMNRLWQ